MSITTQKAINFTCDEKSCSKTFGWEEEKVAADPNALPDVAWRVLTLVQFNGIQAQFCSKHCLLTHLRELVPLKSPREIAAEKAAQQNKDIQKQADNTFEQLFGNGQQANPAPNKLIEFPAAPTVEVK